MGKRKVRILFVILILGVITAAAVTVKSMDQDEMGQVRNAMRNLRRLDNLEFSYQNTFSGKEGEETSRIDVWSDQLTGQWTAEYYTSDEDGTWMYLQQFCDGMFVYDYNEWNGDWSGNSEVKSMEAPNWDELTTISYRDSDILDVACNTQGEYMEISHTFTPEYISQIMQQNQSEMETMFQRYEDNTAFKDVQDITLAVDQYQNTQITDAKVIYQIDKNNILRRKEYLLTMVRPQLVTDGISDKKLGEEEEIAIRIVVEVTGYNQNVITDKIEALRPELEISH